MVAAGDVEIGRVVEGGGVYLELFPRVAMVAPAAVEPGPGSGCL